MRAVKDLKDVQIVLNEILDWKQSLETKANNMHGLQIKNVGAATAADDAITFGATVEKLNDLKRQMEIQLTGINQTLQKMRAAFQELGYPIR
jgi:hypothetical protein